ncbi:uncharacterized protein LOC132754276 [Ruditapes philippinarum]|uniref:uncharacterized protein LOC132754276 n=1 Tax=Ruditapes philippinarum TaxID=129788 RepID=UPI00295B1DDC|nr:uncharacterized protein LOC132754276 [Ruditapes philippinarum]
MFEIPDEDDFWNDELEDNLLSKTSSFTDKENRPQLRVPNSTCTGNPAKRLCTDFSRDVALPVQAELNKELPQFRGVRSANNHNESVLMNKSIPKKLAQQSNITVVNTGTPNVPSLCNNPTVVNNDRTNVSVHHAQQRNKTETFTDAPFHIPFPKETSLSQADSIEHYERSNICRTAIGMDQSIAPPPGSDKNNSGICSDISERKITERNSFPSSNNKTHTIKEPQNIQSDNNNVSRTTRRRSNENEAGDHVTPQRKRKFPGPAGLLPKLGPGRNLDMMSPVSLITTTPVTNKSPKDDSTILCSQQTDDIFNELPWQRLLTDLEDDGQKLLKKYSISSTLLKSGKKQLVQGKAALIFGIIESIESHGSEASVTIRDRSGRMQGTIHHDLLKDHEADLQAGTVLVLKQVSIISLSNRNHYLNITPSNVVMLYRGGEGSLRSLKFHGSEDSLQSVLSALEKKAASQHSSLNTSLNMTPSSHSGSRRYSTDPGTPQQFGASPLSGLGTNTPQRFVTSPITPVTNQRIFNPHSPVTGGSPATATPSTSGVRNVSVVNRDMNQRGNNFTPNFRNTNLQSGMNTPCGSVSENTYISTPNTNFKVIPVQDNVKLSNLSSNNVSSNNNHTVLNNVGNTSIRPGQPCNNVQNVSVKNFQNQNPSANPVLNTPNSVGKSKWKFKSPPTRNSSLPSSPDINTTIPGKIPTNAVSSKIPTVNAINTNVTPNTGAIKSAEGQGTNQHQTIGIKTTGSVGGNKSVNGGTSSWSFKTANVLHTPGQTDKPVTHVSDENLWEDDMDDDILSQLSEDFT